MHLPLKLGDYLLALELISHLRHLLLALTQAEAESTTGAPWFTFRLFVPWCSVTGGVCEERGLPRSLPRGAFPELPPLRGCSAPTAASQWHLALGCRTAPQQRPRSAPLPPVPHGPAHPLPKTRVTDPALDSA